jgi:RimJ/RimL family protein N-acetyltransferase
MLFGSRLLRKGWQALVNLKPGHRTHVDPVSPLEHSQPKEPTDVAVRTGDRVYLRKHRLSDRETFIQWYQDPEIAELLRHDLSPLTRMQAQGYFDSIVLPSSARGLCWAICTNDTDQLIGSTAIVDVNGVTRSALFRIVIGDKSRWNMGFGTEATGLVLAEAFTTHNLQRVNLEVFTHNPRAQRAYLRAGFDVHGQHAEWVSRAHRQIDVMEMSITRDSWLARVDQAT